MTRVTVALPGRDAITASSFCAPCVAQELQAQTAAVQKSYQVSAEAQSTDVRWEGILAFEGVMTGESMGRFIEPGAFKWESLPIPLRWDEFDDGAHAGAVVVGLIESLERRPDGSIYATGFIDTASEYGYKVYGLMQKGLLRGVSVDLDEMEVELRVKEELLLAEPVEEPAAPVADANGYVTVAKASPGEEMLAVLGALIRGATLCDIPAFKNAYVSLVASGEPTQENPREAIVASAPVLPPAAWFENPRLSEPTPITITEDGRIFGHAALWGTCHTGFQNTCVTPPRSASQYAWFRTGDLVTAEGTHIPVGKVTMSTGHAGMALSAAPASAHYDDTGVVAADVASGEDSHGVWISGALRSTLTDEQIRELRAAPMSGDWRRVGGNLEMVALLAVNLPGFPVPRTKALVASGYTNTLLSPVQTAAELAAAETTSAEWVTSILRRAKLAKLAKEFRHGV